MWMVARWVQNNFSASTAAVIKQLQTEDLARRQKEADELARRKKEANLTNSLDDRIHPVAKK